MSIKRYASHSAAYSAFINDICHPKLQESSHMIFISTRKNKTRNLYLFLKSYIKVEGFFLFSEAVHFCELQSDSKSYKKAFQLKANHPFANRCIVCVHACENDGVHVNKFEQVSGHMRTPPLNWQTDRQTDPQTDQQTDITENITFLKLRSVITEIYRKFNIQNLFAYLSS